MSTPRIASGAMSVVKINALEVPSHLAQTLEQRFANRAGEVDKMDGFEAFELLRPTEGGRYLVYTRWRSREDFDAWRSSRAFEAGHRQHTADGPISNESELWILEVLDSEYAPAALAANEA